MSNDLQKIASQLEDIANTLDAQMEQHAHTVLKNLRAVLPAIVTVNPTTDMDTCLSLAVLISRKMISVAWDEQRRDDEERAELFKSPITTTEALK